MNIIQDQVAFGAKLVHCNVNVNEQRLSVIAKTFEEETRGYPKDIFTIETNDKGGIYFYPTYDKKELKSLNSYDKGEISQKTTNILKKTHCRAIGKALANIFIIRRKADAMLADYFQLEDKHGLCDVIYANRDDSMLGKFLDRALKVRKDMTKIMLSSDNLLKNFKGIHIV